MLTFILLITCIGIYGAPSEHLGVVGGRNATKGELPYITSYEEYQGEDRNPICGASIITKSWVITAAHCLGGTPKERTWIHAGMIDVNDTDAQRRQVVKTVRHDNFVQFGGDIALIKVDPPFEFNDLVQPIKVPKQDAEVSSGTAILSGWGLHSFMMSTDWSSILQTVELPIIPYEERMGVVGGRNATKGELPYITSYEEYQGNDRDHICGASIITKSWVITAAHCLQYMPKEGSWIHAGIIDVNDTDAQRRQVVKTVIHGYFAQFGGDIALIKVDPPFEFNDLVQPIKVPKQDAEVSSGTAILSGWGLHSFMMSTDWSSMLQTVELPIVPYEGPVTGGKGACYGDSGGPLVQDGVLIGAVSWGTHPCAHDGSVTIYTKVSSYIDWISENIDETMIFV
ncbi:unnamed protein product [Diabrotica balteata]|uniref:Peptidase S1 domain-containing protein n=1 Tax=Diabrotica balteata TaxID=107213 RepID=A0A9N9SJV5_DIABA|nr:unnamed protein product [Diabrotica balteata]